MAEGGWFAGWRDLIPQAPVLGDAAARAAFPGERAADVAYVGPARVAHPVLPLQVFGVRYDLDVVLRSRHPDWDMHEYARVATPGGPLWLAKDARSPGKTQTIVGDVDPMWLPEVPVERRRAPLRVVDRSTAGSLDIGLSYDNIDGVPVDVRYRGPLPTRPRWWRNASTMGHSADAVAAVLDLSHLALARSASIRIGGEDQPLVRIAGLVPFAVLLQQTQAGLSAGRFDLGPADGGLWTRHAGPFVGGATQRWEVSRGEGAVEVVQRDPLRTLTFRFLDHDGALELASARVSQFGVAQDPCLLQLYPALPDVRRRWTGAAMGAFGIDVHGQRAHGVGRYEARWEGDAVVIWLRGAAPSWLARRPVRVTVTFADDGVARVDAVIDPG